MKINNHPISFQKHLVAKCNVLKNSKPYKCTISELDKKQDRGYFCDKERKADWEESFYWDDFIRNFENSRYAVFENRDRFFVLEHSKKCLGVMEVKELPNNDIGVVYLETNPNYAGSGKKPIKYIGETMLSYLANVAEKSNSRVFIYNSSNNAYDFYTSKCGFDDLRNPFCSLNLDKDSLDKLIEQNMLHTKKKMELVG